MGIFLLCVLGSAVTAGQFAATLPFLRTSLTRDSARQSIVHLKALTQGSWVMIGDETEILAVGGEGSDAFRIGEPLPTWLVPRPEDRLLVKPRLTEQAKGLPFGSAVVVPVVVRGSRVGSLVVLYRNDQRLQPDDTRVVSETGALIAAELELSEIEAQNQRLALAALRALRAQISPHFIYNALAAVARLYGAILTKRGSSWQSLHTSYGVRFVASNPRFG